MFKNTILPAVLFGLTVFFFDLPLRAETALLFPSADTTLIETAPTNNLGGTNFFNAGTTDFGTHTRALVRFDLQSIPAGSRILSAELVVEVVREPRDEGVSSVFYLHRLLKPWGEGNKIADDPQSPGLGAGATAGEATWISRFTGTTNNWAIPGGASGIDFSNAISSEQTIYTIGFSPYSFASTPQLVADVQNWVDGPELNFGWLLKSRDEGIRKTARGFGSRENPGRAPYLLIEYLPAPQLHSISKSGDWLLFAFIAEPAISYSVERADSFSGSWTVFTNIPPQTNLSTIVVSNAISGPQKFYRALFPR